MGEKGKKRRFCAAVLCMCMLTATCLVRTSAAIVPVVEPGTKLIPMGTAVGIILFSHGVRVVGLSGVETDKGSQSPGKACGLKAGDVITHINGSEVDTIEQVVTKVEERSSQTVAAYREKLYARMQEVLQSATVDENRLLTEAAIFADKTAVDEETVRLRSHIAQLRTMLRSDEPVGRKLDFLIQEVNRECNTIGSKCNDLSIAQDVVNMKAEVEKIREQVQNIE